MSSNLFDLSGKIALVTGCNKGIGKGMALALAAAGANIIGVSANMPMQDGETELAVKALGKTFKPYRCDFGNRESLEAFIQKVMDENPIIDILVNNAGITGFEHSDRAQDPENATLADWHTVHKVNLDGVFLGCKHGIRAMRQSKSSGSIINLSSRSGLVGIPGAAAYASSKAAIRNHTKTVALYCAEQGLPIRCNSIHPAAILTPMWDPLLGEGPERETRMQEFVLDCPMRRFGKPEEVAAVAVLLASDEAGYMNGAELNLDGGILAGAVMPPSR